MAGPSDVPQAKPFLSLRTKAKRSPGVTHTLALGAPSSSHPSKTHFVFTQNTLQEHYLVSQTLGASGMLRLKYNPCKSLTLHEAIGAVVQLGMGTCCILYGCRNVP